LGNAEQMALRADHIFASESDFVFCRPPHTQRRSSQRERVRGASLLRITTQSEQFQATTRSARAISWNQGLTRNTFELCPEHIVKN